MARIGALRARIVGAHDPERALDETTLGLIDDLYDYDAVTAATVGEARSTIGSEQWAAIVDAHRAMMRCTTFYWLSQEPTELLSTATVDALPAQATDAELAVEVFVPHVSGRRFLLRLEAGRARVVDGFVLNGLGHEVYGAGMLPLEVAEVLASGGPSAVAAEMHSRADYVCARVGTDPSGG